MERALTHEPLSIGRGQSDDFVLSDVTVTRQQLRLEWDADQNCHVLEQTGDSSTLVNNIPVKRLASIGHRLMEGDQIQVGRTVLRLVSSATDGSFPLPPPS